MSKPPDKQPDPRRRGGRRRRRAALPLLVLRDRDREIVRWVARHGVVTPELIGRRFFWRADRKDYGKWAAYRRIRALEVLGLVIFATSPTRTKKK